MNTWNSRFTRNLESICAKIAETDHIDDDLNTSATLFAMNLMGYVTIPIDPINDPDGNEVGFKWVNVRQNTVKALHDLLGYYGTLPYDEQMEIRETLKEIDADGSEEDIVNLADEIIHEYHRFEKI